MKSSDNFMIKNKIKNVFINNRVAELFVSIRDLLYAWV